jgi:hypothetical protein
MRPNAGRLISYVAPREHIFALVDSTDDQAADSDGEDRKHDQYNHCEIECVFDDRFLVRQENGLPKSNVPSAASQSGVEILICGV